MYLEVRDLKKGYGDSNNFTSVLRGVSFSVEEGQLMVIEGSSGCGKSTLLHCVGGLMEIDGGHIHVCGSSVSEMNSAQMAAFRRHQVGFVFQDPHLIRNLTVLENIQLCAYLNKQPMDIPHLMDVLDLKEQRNKFPNQISGGQQQRCAIARALVKKPKLLLCDEPTGSLDRISARELLILLEAVRLEFGVTILLVTHNTAIKDMAHRFLFLKDGVVDQDVRNPDRIPPQKLEGL
ncbi:MAG: ABC transporter ATP-binding protein [Lachnospiraceae bacterium]|nr:ABC transporter ATP-binding protein [Lachnospiraceae bacterium]